MNLTTKNNNNNNSNISYTNHFNGRKNLFNFFYCVFFRHVLFVRRAMKRFSFLYFDSACDWTKIKNNEYLFLAPPKKTNILCSGGKWKQLKFMHEKIFWRSRFITNFLVYMGNGDSFFFFFFCGENNDEEFS